MYRSYSEMRKLEGYDARLEYLKLLDDNALSPRGISGDFYRSHLWRTIRKMAIDRDQRFDLGVFGLYIHGPVFVHHIEPIEDYDIINLSERLTSLDNLVCTSLDTHNSIHYKSQKEEYVERREGDTIFW